MRRFFGLLLAFCCLLCVSLSSPAKTLQQDDAANGGELAHQSREAAGEDDTAQFKHSPSVQMVARVTGLSTEGAYWLCILINFAIVAGFIAYASKKNLPGIIRGRTANIQKAMEEARTASEEANRRLGDIEQRLSKLDQEISQMATGAEREAAAEEERIKAAAEDDVKRIVNSAEQEISAAAKAARRELTAFAADLAVDLAKKQIVVSSDADSRLVNRFGQELATTGSRNGAKGES